MKILCVIPAYWPAFNLGGPIFSVHALNKALAAKGTDVSVYTTNACLGKNVVLNQQVILDKVKVSYFSYARLLEFLGPTGWQFSPALANALKRNIRDFDIVYIVAVWNYPVAIAAYYCRKYKVPYIISPRGLLYPYTAGKKSWKKLPYWRLVIGRAIEAANLIHYTSEDEAQKCHLSLKLNNQYRVIPNGIDPDAFIWGSKERFLRKYPELRDKKIILFLGRINWKKGLDILVKAYADIAAQKSDSHLLIAGSGDAAFTRQVKNWVCQYGITGRVTFTALLTGDDKSDAYACADIFVLPSYSENFGIAAVEALNCKLPVIVSDQVGIYKEVLAANAGLVINTDYRQLAAAINKLLDDPDLRLKMGGNGRRLVNEKYRLDLVADNMLKMFKSQMPGAKD